MKTPELQIIICDVRDGLPIDNRRALALAAEIERLESCLTYMTAWHESARARAEAAEARVRELEGALEMGQRNCDELYDELREERDDARRCAEAAETRYAASQDALTECMGELREARERVAELEMKLEAAGVLAKMWNRERDDAIAESAQLRAELEGIVDSMNACGCSPICHCNDNVGALLAWKEATVDGAKAALADTKGTP